MRAKRATHGVQVALQRLDAALEKTKAQQLADKRRAADALIASQIPALPW